MHEPSSIRTHLEPRLVTYSAIVESPSSIGIREAVSDEITYAAGDYPPDLARPIWWHKMKNLNSKIDIALFPDDTDYKDYDLFLTDVDTIIKGAFFSAGQSFSELYSNNREFVNLWAAPFGVHSSGCDWKLDPLWGYSSVASRDALTPIVDAMDGQVVLHRDRFTDCSNIVKSTGWSTVDVNGRRNGYDPAWLLIHESGHSVHGLGDEYLGGGNHAANPCANVFASRAECESVGSARGADNNTRCERITNGASTIDIWHRVLDGPIEDLMQRNFDSDWLTDCRYCVLETFKHCETGNCFP